MTVLSDTTIAGEMAHGLLIERGDPTQIGACSYQFRPGKIFTGGEAAQIIDWMTPPANAVFVIKPGAMVWVRMRERVKLPNNVCATWWQTHTLSKKGIMLINSSVVDPGYEGELACLFVNFGKVSVPISPSTIIAKLLFHNMDRSVATPYTYRISDEKYDDDLYEVALSGPLSFLNVADLSTELVVQKEKILKDIAEDAPKRVRRAFVWAFLGLVLLVAALSFVPWLQTEISPNLKDYVDSAVDEHLVSRMTVPPAQRTTSEQTENATPSPDQFQAILKRLDTIETKLSVRSGNAQPVEGAGPQGGQPRP
jgi:deoxycytidine triphosphate deaminase